MSRTINAVSYALQGTAEQSATYGAIVSTVPTTVKFLSLPSRQNGLPGVRTTRSITQTVTLASGVKAQVTESHTSFVPEICSKTDAQPARAILKLLMAEASYDAGVASEAVE